MKTKLTLLAAVLLAGIASTSAVIGRDWVYTPPATNFAPAAAKDHCDMPGMAGMSHQGGMCDMGHMSSMGGMCGMGAAPAADKDMACHTEAHAAKAHKGCCN